MMSRACICFIRSISDIEDKKHGIPHVGEGDGRGPGNERLTFGLMSRQHGRNRPWGEHSDRTLSEVPAARGLREGEAGCPSGFVEFISDSPRFPAVTMLLLLEARGGFDFEMFLLLVINFSEVRLLGSFGGFRRRVVAICG
ncbi:hypothetical protein HJG60_012147 [Phyllostomus discolor]|uniref:Uncharacterized protein n=1 Tax=Phyllostomus discolor TaxID=89673 RepID=A0A833ZPM1_9CHIR|nr:hypothetical protein HJG60_012147 [Phyllostomus discolor]